MIPLTVRSYYSMMWGTRSPQQICSAAKQLGYPCLALTDTDNLYGLWPFIKACRQNNIRPVIGAELTDPVSRVRAVCLVENETGYRNLCRLITRRCLAEDEPFDLKTIVPGHAAGLTVITQSPDLLTHWYETGISTAAAVPRKPDSAAFKLRETARRLGVLTVATPGSFFLEPNDAKVHRLLRAIDLNTSLSKLTPLDAAPSDAWLASPVEYQSRFAVWPETIKATEKIAERLSYTGPRNGLVMPPWKKSREKSSDQLLREAAYNGAKQRYENNLPVPVIKRLEHELRIIKKMNFSSYFLVVKDIVQRSPRICGRGSGAASLVAYSLEITNVCPIKHNLYFERFLNPGRLDPPDIDIDFAWDERDDVLFSVLQQYEGHAALVCNHVAFRPRMAIRETAKVYGLTDREIGQLSKRLPWFWRAAAEGDDLLARLKTQPELRRLDFPEPWPEIIQLAQQIIGIPRHISVHPGGVVITPRPLNEYVPIEPAPKGVPVIQWEKDGTEEAGLVKIDLLGNRSLAVIRDAITNIHTNGIPFDEQSWNPEDDFRTQENVARGETMGCFYIESPATRLFQKKARVGDFEHLVIHSSLIRPAANAYVREYIRRLHGGKWEPIHPLLSGVLDETYGIMVFQEDVSKTAVALAGFSHVEADGFRKILSKKDKERGLRVYKNRFTAGARARGVNDKQINAVWEMMMSFEGYSFCKPHSASYARVSFQSAYLKTHYPAEFMASVISNRGGFYSTFAYVSEARRMGIKITRPDINKCVALWTGRGKSIRVGLLSVKNLGAATRQRILKHRAIRPFSSLIDFLERIRPDEPETRALIHAGAFDSLHSSEKRASLLWDLTGWQRTRAKQADKPNLFTGKFNTPVEKPSFPPDKIHERHRREFAVLGFLCNLHPMLLHADTLKSIKTVKAKDIHNFKGRHIRFAGLLITGKVVHTKHGDPMEFLTFEDETGLVETTFFPKAYRRFCAILDRSRPFILSGKVDQDFGVATLAVNRVDYLPLRPGEKQVPKV